MTTTNDHTDDFYEDDEPVEKIRAAFERGEKGLTGHVATPGLVIGGGLSGVRIEHNTSVATWGIKLEEKASA